MSRDPAQFELGDDELLWRYVDLGALVWTLVERRLFLRNPNTLDDPYEGQFCKADVEHMLAWEGEHAEHNRRFFSRLADFPVYISCWHNHACESALMWKAYGGTVGACIQTTVASLRQALPESRLERVRYIDYDTSTFDTTNALNPYFYKRDVYAAEKEVRAAMFPPAEDATWEYDSMGASLVIDPEQLIHQVVLGPNVASWFLPSLKNLLAAMNLDIAIRGSTITRDPYRIYETVPVTVLVPWELSGKIAVPRFIFAGPKASAPASEAQPGPDGTSPAAQDHPIVDEPQGV